MKLKVSRAQGQTLPLTSVLCLPTGPLDTTQHSTLYSKTHTGLQLREKVGHVIAQSHTLSHQPRKGGGKKEWQPLLQGAHLKEVLARAGFDDQRMICVIIFRVLTHKAKKQ